MIVWGGDNWFELPSLTPAGDTARNRHDTDSHVYANSKPNSHCHRDGNGNAAAYANTEAAPDSTLPALITQMISKLRAEDGLVILIPDLRVFGLLQT